MDSPARTGAVDRNGDGFPQIDAVQPSDDFSRRVLDSMVDAYVGLDADGRVLEWNRAATEMLGWTRDEALARILHAT
ncbi:MAG: PAS domain-containing protein, partial [Mycobacterium sp.]|nr:PAS domain-containing protein [Mycobacterium sp.]